MGGAYQVLLLVIKPTLVPLQFSHTELSIKWQYTETGFPYDTIIHVESERGEGRGAYLKEAFIQYLGAYSGEDAY